MRETLKALWLDWFNNWLTMSRFAEHHGIPLMDAQLLTQLGCKYHHEDIQDERRLTLPSAHNG